MVNMIKKFKPIFGLCTINHLSVSYRLRGEYVLFRINSRTFNVDFLIQYWNSVRLRRKFKTHNLFGIITFAWHLIITFSCDKDMFSCTSLAETRVYFYTMDFVHYMMCIKKHTLFFISTFHIIVGDMKIKWIKKCNKIIILLTNVFWANNLYRSVFRHREAKSII